MWNLIRSFWKVDRIRISPLEGRLLRLSNKSIVVIDHQPFQIKKRKVISKGTMICVKYLCEGEPGQGWLRVTQTASILQPEVEWKIDDFWIQYGAEEVEVFGDI